jgi:hypothetical protein
MDMETVLSDDYNITYNLLKIIELAASNVDTKQLAKRLKNLSIECFKAKDEYAR